MAAHALYSPSARRAMRKCVADFSPEIAHVRGIYHHLSPSILWELKRQRIPVLYHLNDFKMLCPTYNFVANGRSCERCSGGAFYNATRGCYKGPRTSALVLAGKHICTSGCEPMSAVSTPSSLPASLSARSWLPTASLPNALKSSLTSRRCPMIGNSGQVDSRVLCLGTASGRFRSGLAP
jgi:hypothetical protein